MKMVEAYKKALDWEHEITHKQKSYAEWWLAVMMINIITLFLI